MARTRAKRNFGSGRFFLGGGTIAERNVRTGVNRWAKMEGKERSDDSPKSLPVDELAGDSPGRRCYWRKMSQRSSALKKRIVAATVQAIICVRRELANSPIRARLPVNWIRGMMAKGN